MPAKKERAIMVTGRGRLLKTSLSTFQRGLLPIVLASVAECSYPWLFLKRIRQWGHAHSKSILAAQILRPNFITRNCPSFFLCLAFLVDRGDPVVRPFYSVRGLIFVLPIAWCSSVPSQYVVRNSSANCCSPPDCSCGTSRSGVLGFTCSCAPLSRSRPGSDSRSAISSYQITMLLMRAYRVRLSSHTHFSR